MMVREEEADVAGLYKVHVGGTISEKNQPRQEAVSYKFSNS